MLGSRRKAFRPFYREAMKPRPSCCNSATLKKLVVFLKKVELSGLQLQHSKKKNILAVWEALLKLGGSCGVWEKSCEVRGLGCGYLTVVRLAMVTAVPLSMYYKLTGGRFEFFDF